MSKKTAKINDNCINCGMCYNVCPFSAINEPGDSNEIDSSENINNEHYFINTKKCIGCGRCCEVCPINNIEIKEN